MNKICFAIVLYFSLIYCSFGQITYPENEPKYKLTGNYLFVNATIHVAANKVIENGQLLIEGNTIKEVGSSISNTINALKIDCNGNHLYPSFIDCYSNIGFPKTIPGKINYTDQQIDSKKEGAYSWNDAINSEKDASRYFKFDEKDFSTLRDLGFGLINTHEKDGIARGTSTLLFLGDENLSSLILKEKATSNFSFNRGSSTQTYPYSLMGAVALYRQTLYDAEWYKNGGNKLEKNLSLEAINQNSSLPVIFETYNIDDLSRAINTNKEFKIDAFYKTIGDEFQDLDLIKKIKNPLIVSLNFPSAYFFNYEFLSSEIIPLKDLKIWDLAPSNSAFLEKNGINFALTTADLESPADFQKQLKTAIKRGLSKQKALESLTTIPAQILGLENKIGTLEKGKIANITVYSGELFNPKSLLLENWVNGKQFIIKNEINNDIRGKYLINPIDSLVLSVEGERQQPVFKVFKKNVSSGSQIKFEKGKFLSFLFNEDSTHLGYFTGFFNEEKLDGQVTMSNSRTYKVKLVKFEEFKEPDQKTDSSEYIVEKINYPLGAYGYPEKQKPQTILIKNTTVWTGESQGILKNYDVLIKDGKINQIGQNLSDFNSQVIDGKNKHLTAGIIDEHSHIALYNINEVATNSAQVRMKDVINASDINIFRQLAGGVTCSQLLHGSANCIGGQSALIKLKWGEKSEELLFKDAPQFIKFALGENVKRGNFPLQPNRYPVSRMGVEQVFISEFQKAKEYEKAWANYNKNKQGIPPRRNLALEPLVEILNNKRHITCHSYIQSEINMLMHVADSMDFAVNTFTHILEGYKLADKLKNRKINASTFSDWWAYKMEVKEAIPYNAALMTKVGVNVAINSDDAEQARRLNQEAAKTMLYGGLTEEEAWKTVTLNPAKMLHIDAKVGSIKEGKDADLVLWSDNPLSIYAIPEKTIIEGTIYFDRAKLPEMNAENKKERLRILQKMEKDSAGSKINFEVKPKEKIDCMTLNNIF